MSRAFVKEQDDVPEELVERSVSANLNVVTAKGLKLIDAEIEALRRMLAQGQHKADKAAIARVSRDLRYWMQRRSTAQLVDPPVHPEAVAFATRVTIIRDDGRKQVFSLVGEDETDPASGFISYTSPMARALVGKSVGDFADVPGGEAEIVKLEAIGPEG